MELNKKKKRRFALYLYNHKTVKDEELRALEHTFSSMSDFTLLKIQDPDEGLKLLVFKSIDVVILDQSFFNNEETTVQYALEIKRRKKCPILFLSNNDAILIEEYRKHMYMYEEMDDYMNYPLDFLETQKRVRRVTTVEGRTSKRFSAQIPLKMLRLSDDIKFDAKLADISLVGLGIHLQADDSIQKLEQLQVQIPLSPLKIFHRQYGDFLKLAVRVRRVSLDGRSLGCSIEYITPLQADCLTLIIEELARRLRHSKLPAVYNKTQSRTKSVS